MSRTGKVIQAILLVGLVAAGINLHIYLQQRHSAMVAPKKTEVALDSDYYVIPKKLRPQDLKDAKELTNHGHPLRVTYGDGKATQVEPGS